MHAAHLHVELLARLVHLPQVAQVVLAHQHELILLQARQLQCLQSSRHLTPEELDQRTSQRWGGGQLTSSTLRHLLHWRRQSMRLRYATSQLISLSTLTPSARMAVWQVLQPRPTISASCWMMARSTPSPAHAPLSHGWAAK